MILIHGLLRLWRKRLVTGAFLASCKFLRKKIFAIAFNTYFKIESELSRKVAIFLLIVALIYDCGIDSRSGTANWPWPSNTTTNSNWTDKPLQIITSKYSTTKTIEEGKEAFVHVVIQSLKDHINSLENQPKDKQKIMGGLFNIKCCQHSCNSANRSHQDQRLAQNVKNLPTGTNGTTK